MLRSYLARYGLATTAVALMILLKGEIEARVGPGPPLIHFVPAVTFSAWFGGIGPGLWATALSALVVSFVYFAPVGSFVIARNNDLFRLALFLLEGIMTSFLMGQLHASRKSSESSNAEAERYRDTLRQSEERLQAIIDNGTAVIYLKDTAGRYILVNRRFEATNGIDKPQAIGKTDRDLFGAELADVFRAHDREVLDAGKPIEWEDNIPNEQGMRTYLTVKFPLFDDQGNAYAVGGVSSEITDRKQAEIALRESEQRFRSLSACSPVGIFLSDVTGLCTYTNPRCQEIFGIGLDQSLGDGWTESIHPDDRVRVVTSWARAARDGQSSFLEYRIRDAKGAIRWILDRTAPLISDAGTLIGHVGTVEDITDRKRVEDEVRRERDFAEGLIGTAQAIVLVLDRRGRILRLNPFLRRVTGRCDAVEGEDWFATFVPTRDRARARAAFERAWAESEGSQVTHPIIAAVGREREIEWANRIVPGVVGDVPGMLAIGHDITALKEAQHRAVQAERLAAIGEMITGLAHESRNALQRGQACLEMLALRLADRPEALDLLAGVQEAQDDLHRLYEEVRGYAAPIVLERRVCCLRRLLRDSWTHLEPSWRGRPVRLVERGESDSGCVADPFRLTQVFRNVLDNALAACRDPAEIVVDWAEVFFDGQLAVRIAVRDNGPGLSPEQRAHLFEPFYTTKTQGTGLGLSITRRIVEAHGGLVELGPEDGQGATVLLTLPRGSP